MSETRLSLFQTKSELRGLAEQRCDALDRLAELQAMGVEPEAVDARNAIPVTEAEIKVCDGLIRAYISKEIEKVDSSAWILLDLTARMGAHKAEADRLYMLAKSEEATRDRIEELILDVMDEFKEKRLYGRVHDLLSVGNGSVQPLNVAQPDLVPQRFQRVTVSMSMFDWANIAKPVLDRNGDAYKVKETEPDKPKIRKALEAGEGVPGCRLEPRGRNLQIK